MAGVGATGAAPAAIPKTTQATASNPAAKAEKHVLFMTGSDDPPPFTEKVSGTFFRHTPVLQGFSRFLKKGT